MLYVTLTLISLGTLNIARALCWDSRARRRGMARYRHRTAIMSLTVMALALLWEAFL